MTLYEGGAATGTAHEWLRRCVVTSPWHRRDSVIARGVAFAVWIAFAGWELAGASLATQVEGSVLAVLGVVGTAWASRYELRVVRALAIPPNRT